MLRSKALDELAFPRLLSSPSSSTHKNKHTTHARHTHIHAPHMPLPHRQITHSHTPQKHTIHILHTHIHHIHTHHTYSTYMHTTYTYIHTHKSHTHNTSPPHTSILHLGSGPCPFFKPQPRPWPWWQPSGATPFGKFPKLRWPMSLPWHISHAAWWYHVSFKV